MYGVRYPCFACRQSCDRMHDELERLFARLLCFPSLSQSLLRLFVHCWRAAAHSCGRQPGTPPYFLFIFIFSLSFHAVWHRMCRSPFLFLLLHFIPVAFVKRAGNEFLASRLRLLHCNARRMAVKIADAVHRAADILGNRRTTLGCWCVAAGRLEVGLDQPPPPPPPGSVLDIKSFVVATLCCGHHRCRVIGLRRVRFGGRRNPTGPLTRPAAAYSNAWRRMEGSASSEC